MVAAGILFGLASAVLLALAYLLSRRFFVECRADLGFFFGLNHVQMGLVAALLLPFVLDGPLGPWRAWAGWLAGYTGFYLCGQALLFLALARADSSQVSPLLGLKIPVLALFTSQVLGQPLSLAGWSAVALCSAAGLLLAPVRRLHDRRALFTVAAVCVCYCGADLCIPGLVRALAPASHVPALLGVSLAYLAAGGVGAAVLLRGGHGAGGRREHLYALPYSLAWLGGMVMLFACFPRIGVVYGNMLQALRGILSVALGALVARAGWAHLDGLRDRRALLRRALGALVMAIAIVLYHLARAA